ncbi:MAG: type II secretion system protein M [Proteobacteria bacterium]|nr:type II secretion system protein M [Pseudomonadota bacterium]
MAGAATSWAQARQALRAAWAARDARERRLLLLAAWTVGLFLLWTLALQPALRTLREAPARLDGLEAQLQAMQAQAAEVRGLRATPPLPRAQAVAALKVASERLGDRARLQEQGERAVLTLNGASGQQLQAWLAEVRSSARARAVDINLTRGEQGLSGAVIVTLPGG